MQTLNQQLFTGERALFKANDLIINNCVFENGESPLKESRDITIDNSIFRWKYPLWYAENIRVMHSSLLDSARSGIWYTHNIEISDSAIQAPKTFRRASQIVLNEVVFSNALETLWTCDDITLNNCQLNGDYIMMNSRHIKADNLKIVGNYAFDGAENIEITNSHLLSKDAFWNCKNVVVKDSIIVGEYLGWNSENITFINCTIESNQGLCYMNDVKLINCKLIHTDLAFEYSTVEAEIQSSIDSIKNPISGRISAHGIDEIIFDDPNILKQNTQIIIEEAD